MLNRTPRASKNATALAPKRSRWLIAGVLFGVVLLSTLALLALPWSTDDHTSDCVRLSSEDSNEDVCVYLEVVSELTELTKGLSDRESLPDDEGMLFDFGAEGAQCMWMKDMHFPLDMIWLDANGIVTDIQTDISPETYPETFCGQSSARYVIEVNAGLVRSSSVHIGQQIQL